MRRWAAGLLALIAATGVIGCGGGEQTDLAAEADEVCSDYEERFAQSGNIGETPDQIAAEFTYLDELASERHAELRELEAPDAVREDWERYLEIGERFLAVNEQVIEAANEGDMQRVSTAFDRLVDPASQRLELADELGMEVCGAPADPGVETTGTSPPEDLEHAEPSNSAEEAAEELVAAVDEEDCERIGELAHSSLGWLDRGACAELLTNFGGAEILGVEEHGPAAVAELESELGGFFTVYFVVGDGERYRYAGEVTNDGRGLRPASDDADAEETVSALLDALSAGDSEARQELLADPRNDPVPVELAGELADGGEAEASMLGINQALSLHQVDAGERSYVLVLAHMPGGQSEYRIANVLTLPPADGQEESQEDAEDGEDASQEDGEEEAQEG